MTTTDWANAAAALQLALQQRGAVATVRYDFGYIVTFRASWPFRLTLGRGNTWTHETRVDPAMLYGSDPYVVADALIGRVEAEMLDTVLGALVERARQTGAGGRALAPYAREVVDFIAERITPFGAGRETERVRMLGQPFTRDDTR